MEPAPEPSGDTPTQSAHDDYAALLERLKTFGIVVLSVLIDLFFLAAWVLIHQRFDILIHYLSSSREHYSEACD